MYASLQKLKEALYHEYMLTFVNSRKFVEKMNSTS